ncbi:MAG: hypothetical protein HFACDABA_01027 [Anaerolineales bacterium]|nr:hypothetical protein [Anaerolineales bacterium]
MKKIFFVFSIFGLLLSACNIPVPSTPGESISMEQQAATIIAATLTAAASNGEPIPLLPSATEEAQQALPTATQGGPAPTIQPNATPTAGGSAATSTPGTGTPGATLLTVDSNTNCREGPGTTYKVVIVLVAGTQYQMIGRTEDNQYWIVTEIGKPASCWIPAEMSNAFGNTSLLPLVTPSAPTASASGSPAAPTGLKYTYSCAYNADASYTITVKLGWSDRSDNEQGFYVYRNGALIATLPANTSAYTDIFVGTASQANIYQVASFNVTGQKLGGAQTFSCSD